MPENDSTTVPMTSKPSKPYPEFPLCPHATRRWAKKIRGQLRYFGPWSDPDAAIAKYLEEREALHAGRKPRELSEGTTIKELCNKFLIAKSALVDSGELTKRAWQDYKASCDLIVSRFGKRRLVADLDPEDFATLRRKLSERAVIAEKLPTRNPEEPRFITMSLDQ